MTSHKKNHGLLAICLQCVLLLAGTAPQVDAFLRAAQLPEEAPAAAPADSRTAATPPEDTPGPFDSYDRSNPDFGNLQKSKDALKGFPLDQNGIVDWARALREGFISPREVLDGSKSYLPLDLDVIMRHTKAMPFVRFPHKTHTEWLACSNCHPAIFEEKAGSTKIRMEDIFRGRFCGKCHDRVAFITHRACFRCHAVPQESAPPAN